MPAVAPSGVGRNEYYQTDEEYLDAVADALHEEYQAIVDAGFILQVDDPWLTGRLQLLTRCRRTSAASAASCTSRRVNQRAARASRRRRCASTPATASTRVRASTTRR